MKIHENTALLDAFVDGELTAAEMAEVQAHLAECPDCQAYVDDVLAIRADFPTAESTELPADFAGHVMQAVAKTPQSRPKKQPWGKLGGRRSLSGGHRAGAVRRRAVLPQYF